MQNAYTAYLAVQRCRRRSTVPGGEVGAAGFRSINTPPPPLSFGTKQSMKPTFLCICHDCYVGKKNIKNCYISVKYWLSNLPVISEIARSDVEVKPIPGKLEMQGTEL